MNKHIRSAIHAHTNLNVFATVVAILEGGLIYGGQNKAAQKIISICQKEQARQLHKLDAAVAAAESKPVQEGGE